MGRHLVPSPDTERSGWPAEPSLSPRRQSAALQMCYGRSMTEIASRELRNDTAGLLRRVQAGEVVVITVHGAPVAELVPVKPKSRRWIARAELIKRLHQSQADPGLRGDLARLAGDTTEDLGPIR